MSGFLKIVGAIMRKDWRTLWPFAVAVIVLTAGFGVAEIVLNPDAAPDGQMTMWLALVGLGAIALAIATAAFVVILIHLDGPAARKADWMARPVPPLALFVAKAAMIAAVLVIPSMAYEAIVAAARGSRADEALAAAYDSLSQLSYWVTLGVILAWLTTSGLQALVVAILYGVLVAASSLIGLMVGGGEVIAASSRMAWFVHQGMWLSLMVLGALSLWLLMRKRDVAGARAAFAGALAAGLLLSFIPARWIYAAHTQLAPETDATRRVKVSLTSPLCRETAADSTLSAGAASQAILLGPTLDMTSHTVALDGLEPGWIARIDWVETRLPGAKHNPRVLGLNQLANDKSFAVTTAVVPRLKAQLAKQTLRYEYAITLLAPGGARTVTADGTRTPMPGPSSCSAKVNGQSVHASCSRSGLEPNLITATIHQDGTATPMCNAVNLGNMIAGVSCEPSYGPKLIRALSHVGAMSVDANKVVKRPGGPVSVTFQSYEVLAHVRRSLAFAPADFATLPVCPRRVNNLEDLASSLTKQSEELRVQQDALKTEIELRRDALTKDAPAVPAPGRSERTITIERTTTRGG